MNRIIALIIPLVLLVAMGLIVLQQMRSTPPPEPLRISPVAANSTVYPYPAPGTSVAPNSQKDNANSTAAPVPPIQRDGVPSNWSLPGHTGPSANKGQKPPQAQETGNATSEKSNLGRMAAAMGSQNTQSHKGEGSAPKEGVKGSPNTSDKAKTSDTKDTKAKEKGKDKDKDKEKDKDKDKGVEKNKTPASSKKQTMKSIKLTPKGSEMLLVLDGKEKIEYKTFMLKNPERLVVDIAGEWSNLTAPGVPSNSLVKGVRLGDQEKGRRIVLDLKESPKGYDTRREGDKVVVRIY